MFKDILPGYRLHDNGELIRLPYIKTTKNMHGVISFWTKPRSISWSYTVDGYLQADVGVEGKRTTVKQHRILAEAFIDNPDRLPQVNHKNGIKDDNRLENLEWVTAQENVLHSYRTGLASNKGERHPSHRLTKEDVIAIRHLAAGKETHASIAKRFSMHRTTITKIVQNRLWNYENCRI